MTAKGVIKKINGNGLSIGATVILVTMGLLIFLLAGWREQNNALALNINGNAAKIQEVSDRTITHEAEIKHIDETLQRMERKLDSALGIE